MKIFNQIREYKLHYRVLITIAALYALAIVIYFVYTQSIVTAISSSGLILLCSLLPVKPGRLTKKEREAFEVPAELGEILVGLLLGDLYAQKRNGNVRL